MSRPGLLTKSRFKTGCDCPTKLFFTGKKEFGSNKLDNPFLEALAEGGFQVGALAKLYHEDGIEIEDLDVAKAVQNTAELLKREDVTLYEPAFQFRDLLVRVDILVKKGKKVELIEVKAKSLDPSEENPFYNKTLTKKGVLQLNSEWEPYLLNVAFQKYVLQKAHPDWNISAFLMLADKTARASVDGINQRFFLSESTAGQTEIEVASGTSRRDLGDHSTSMFYSLLIFTRATRLLSHLSGVSAKVANFGLDQRRKLRALRVGLILAGSKRCRSTLLIRRGLSYLIFGTSVALKN